MTGFVKLAQWVQGKPLFLVRFDHAHSESLYNSKNGFEHLTVVRQHHVFQDIKTPALCLIETQDFDVKGTECHECFLAVATGKKPVSTFDSRLTIKKLRIIKPSSFQEIEEKITKVRMKRLFCQRRQDVADFSCLSPKLSAHLIELLAQDSDNHPALETALSLLPKLRRVPHINWEQEDAIQSAMSVFGITGSDVPDEILMKRNASSSLSLIGTYLYEDNVVRADASQLPGFDAIAPDVTGRAVFTKRNERLVIYTANKLPLEKMLGVDLIYVNETKGNIIMVQYKMLEEDKKESGGADWIFRPDRQLRKEIARMKIPSPLPLITDYRLSRNPFFFKFVKRRIVDDSHQSIIISLDHLNQILVSPSAKGPKRGIRLSYKSLEGTYLREADMVNLIRSGYIGTHRAETDALATIISKIAQGDRALVLAWQMKVHVQEGDKPDN